MDVVASVLPLAVVIIYLILGHFLHEYLNLLKEGPLLSDINWWVVGGACFLCAYFSPIAELYIGTSNWVLYTLALIFAVMLLISEVIICVHSGKFIRLVAFILFLCVCYMSYKYAQETIFIQDIILMSCVFQCMAFISVSYLYFIKISKGEFKR